ncbi:MULTISPECIES: YqcC family protein [Vibrio]|uniref:YqcC family protein n=1 Tax=Vibrio TaxID=662 RepID=UPI000B8EA06F|nr:MULTISPECIES: YqcC family protein [Vibrio]MBF4423950.1 YqcC family protein [Vibrio anguillarum]NAW89492.1 pseudouridine synthase [Vibrio sp. V24_P1S3T111]NNN98519.1 YqcC family protein [Vibrio sp. B1-2]OXX19803.1 pseudouridine synthase [Vibrio sp. V05_P4A8T149]OXX24348.1 pseudouridine synthase [Vibrio sp. V06_P1A73T115]
MTVSTELTHLLKQLETQLRNTQCWQSQPPSESALMSTEPFSIDTLTPEQWLQWIFIPKMLLAIEQQTELPQGFSLTPYFEEAWQHQAELAEVIALLRLIDEVSQAC